MSRPRGRGRAPVPACGGGGHRTAPGICALRAQKAQCLGECRSHVCGSECHRELTMGAQGDSDDACFRARLSPRVTLFGRAQPERGAQPRPRGSPVVRAGGARELHEGPGGLEVPSLRVWRPESKVKVSAGQVLWGNLPGLLQRPGARGPPARAAPLLCFSLCASPLPPEHTGLQIQGPPRPRPTSC